LRDLQTKIQVGEIFGFLSVFRFRVGLKLKQKRIHGTQKTSQIEGKSDIGWDFCEKLDFAMVDVISSLQERISFRFFGVFIYLSRDRLDLQQSPSTSKHSFIIKSRQTCFLILGVANESNLTAKKILKVGMKQTCMKRK
jgi:hypothetical protein